MEFIGASWVGFSCLLLILTITGRKQWLTIGRLLGLVAIPVTIPLLAFTNEFHGLIWKKAWMDMSFSIPVMAYVRGIGFWILSGYTYALLLAGTVMLLRFYRRSVGIYRRQIGIILLGIAVPWLCNALYLFGSSPISGLDLTPFAFTISGIIFCFGLFRFKLLDIVPIAREELLEAIGDAVLVLDLQDRIVDKNSKADDLIENGFGEVVLRKASEVLPSIFNSVKRLKSHERNHSEIELGPENNRKSYYLQVSHLFSRKNRLVGWLVCLRDITQRKLSEAALRDSEEKFRSISDNALDGIIMIDPEDKISLWNCAAEKMFGYKETEIIGKELHTLLAPRRCHQEYFQRFSESIVTGKAPVISKTVELSALKKDGTEFPIELFVADLSLKGRWQAVGIVRDITDRKQGEAERARLQERLQRAQKMEAIGTMAGGVAHDLNNILSGIVSYPDLLLLDIPVNSPLRKPIEAIRKSGMLAADVVSDLLTIARGVAMRKAALNLNTAVSEYLESAEFKRLEKIHAFVQFKTDLASRLSNISGSAIHIDKVLMNLVVNATEAIEKSGTVTITTMNRYLDAPVIGHENVRQGEYAVLSISDDGPGISPDDMARIFEPFYSKKVMGRSGTGLGLAVVWSAVQDHNGYINVKSSEKGTTFQIYFPVTREEIAEKKETAGLEEYMGDGERILVVDDEEIQREIATGMLTKLGYYTEAISSGEEAIAYVKEHPMDLLVLDMVMPKGINGRETYEKILEMFPGQKAILASGYSKTEEIETAQNMGAGHYIKKPYTLETIGFAIKKELEKSLNV